MTREEYRTAWRTYAAAALQGLTTDFKEFSTPEVLCDLAVIFANVMVEREERLPVGRYDE